jgi:hypothetical protein
MTAAAFPDLTFPGLLLLRPVTSQGGGRAFPASRPRPDFSRRREKRKKRNVFFFLCNSAQKIEWKKIFSRVRFLLH